ncbi:MAG: hypothetical protein QM764_08980 [Chitinophagaceae bacterium]
MKTRNKPKTKRLSKKSEKKKIIVASVAVGVAGILGYFGWQYLKKKKDNSSAADLDEILKSSAPVAVNNSSTYSSPSKIKTDLTRPVISSANTTAKTVSSKTIFPLKKGSKGDTVKQLQQALITKYGKSILPKYGADGDFGSETVNALKKAGLPVSVSESMFNVIVQPAKASSANLGYDLYNATVAKDFNKVISLLQQLQTTDDYNTANTQFKENRIAGVRQTIVNGLLSSFTAASQKEAIKFEFLRMGLQFDGNKWSLSGFDGRPVVTTEATTVWINAAEGVPVPARMVLGNEVAKRLDYTLFENNGKYFLVNTKSIQYLN